MRLKYGRIDHLCLPFSSLVDEDHDRGSGRRLDLNAAGQQPVLLAFRHVALGFERAKKPVPLVMQITRYRKRASSNQHHGDRHRRRRAGPQRGT